MTERDDRRARLQKWAPFWDGDHEKLLRDLREELEDSKRDRQALVDYGLLHDGKMGQHWIYAAAGRLAAGDNEAAVLADFGYTKDRKALDLAMHLGQQLAGECVELERLVHGWEVAELGCPQGVYPDGTPRPCRFCEEPDD